MRIVFDLDGVICELKKPSESYSDVIPKKKIIQKMRNLKEKIRRNLKFFIFQNFEIRRNTINHILFAQF